MASTTSIRELAEPVLTAAGLELWDVELGRDLVRILVDRPQGVDLDALSRASQVLSPLLDAHPDVAPDGRYQLEISSPGVERTLRTPEQYRRFLEAPVAVKTAAPVAGSRRHRGILAAVDEEGITVAPEEGPAVRIAYEQIDRAHTVLVWGPTSKAAARRAPASRRAVTQAADLAARDPKDAS